MEKGGCRGITRIHRLPSRPSHPYGQQPHSLIFMSTLYKATCCLSRQQLTSDHEPACMCHLYRLRIKTHVLTFTMPCIDCFIAQQVSQPEYFWFIASATPARYFKHGNSSCGRIIFSQASVSHSVHGGTSGSMSFLGMGQWVSLVLGPFQGVGG